MKNIFLVWSCVLFVLFVGCSEKKYFTPNKEDVIGEVKFDDTLKTPIIQSNKSGAVLKDGTLVLKDGIYKIALKDNFTFLNTANNLILVANYTNNTLSILNKDGKELYSFPFDYMPISAALQNNILAVVLADNSIVLWDINTNEKLFSHKSANAYTITSKMASPVFADSTIIFPVFDGKIIVVGLDNLKILRTITLGNANFFNNIIFLELDGNNLIVATNKKLMTILGNKDYSYEININDIAYINNKIYILSLEGEVVEFDLLLNKLHSKKFQFANLSAIIFKDSLYTLESQGYLIKINPNDFIDSIYKIDIDAYQGSFYTDDTLYYDDKIIKFPK